MSNRVLFCGLSNEPPKKETYAELRARVLERGCFSVFEATETMAKAKQFERLCRDPELVTIPVGFPWTKVVLSPKDTQ